MKKMYNLFAVLLALCCYSQTNAQVKQQLLAKTKIVLNRDGDLMSKDSFLYKNNITRYTKPEITKSHDILVKFFNYYYMVNVPFSYVNQLEYSDTLFRYNNDMSTKKRISYKNYNAANKPTLEKSFDFVTGVENHKTTNTYYPDDTTIKTNISEYTDVNGDLNYIYYKFNPKGLFDSVYSTKNENFVGKLKYNYMPDNSRIKKINARYNDPNPDSMFVNFAYDASGKLISDTTYHYNFELGIWLMYKATMRKYHYNTAGNLDSLYEYKIDWETGSFSDLTSLVVIKYNSDGKQTQLKSFIKNAAGVLVLDRYFEAGYADDLLMTATEYNPSTSAIQSKYFYTYDASNRVSKVVEKNSTDTVLIKIFKYNTYGNLSVDSLIDYNNSDQAYTINRYYYKNITTSIDNLWAQDKITLYPNPASNVVHIQNQFTTEDIELSVYDINGKMIQNNTLQNGNNTIDISHISAGIYLFHFNDKTNNRSTIEQVSISH